MGAVTGYGSGPMFGSGLGGGAVYGTSYGDNAGTTGWIMAVA